MSRGRGRRLATGAIVGIAIAGFLFIAFWVLCCYCCCFRKKRQQRGRAPVSGGGGGGMFSRFMPGRQRHGGPAMMEAGHGGYGHGHHGVSQPQPTYGYR